MLSSLASRIPAPTKCTVCNQPCDVQIDGEYIHCDCADSIYATQKAAKFKAIDRIERKAIGELAQAIVLLAEREVVADLLNRLIGAEQQQDQCEFITNRHVDLAGLLFDSLTECAPDAVELAQSR